MCPSRRNSPTSSPVIRKPDRTKKMSRPKKPPCSHPTPKWKPMVTRRATALTPSRDRTRSLPVAEGRELGPVPCPSLIGRPSSRGGAPGGPPHRAVVCSSGYPWVRPTTGRVGRAPARRRRPAVNCGPPEPTGRRPPTGRSRPPYRPPGPARSHRPQPTPRADRHGRPRTTPMPRPGTPVPARWPPPSAPTSCAPGAAARRGAGLPDREGPPSSPPTPRGPGAPR